MISPVGKLSLVIIVGLEWFTGVGVLLQADDANQSSSEPPRGIGVPEVYDQDTASESSCPPLCKPLPSGKVMNPSDDQCDVKSIADTHFTGNTGHQLDELLNDVDEELCYQGDSLPIAAEMCDLVAVERILNLPDTDVNMIDDDGKTGLHLASQFGFHEIVEKILAHPEIDVNKTIYTDDKDRSAFRFACSGGHADVVLLFLKHPNVDPVELMEMFVSTAYYGHTEAFCHFLELPEIEVNYARSRDGATALKQASQNGNTKIVETLLKRNEIEVNKTNNRGGAPLRIACKKGHLETVEKLLSRNEIEVNKASTDDETTPLYVACEKGHLEIVEKLLERNETDVNKANNKGSAPLYKACKEGHLEIVEKLLERNETDVNKANNKGSAPLYVACEKGHLEIVEKLLERNETDVNKASNRGGTPLYKACQEGHLEIVEKLLERNDIEVNKTFKDCYTGLTVASAAGHLEIVEKLLEHPNTDFSTYGELAIQNATKMNHTEIVKLLREHSTKQN